MVNRKRRIALVVVLVVLVSILIAVFLGLRWFKSELQPMPIGPSFLVRYSAEKPFTMVAKDLQRRGVVRDSKVFEYYVKYRHQLRPVAEGTYRFNPGMTVDQVVKALHSPLKQMVRIPETNFSYRTAKVLQKKDVLKADDYKKLIKDPAEFADDVDFKLPKTSLEGYLYPDTYDLPPLIGAHDTIVRQLEAFEMKVYPLLKDVKDVNKVLTIASMVEMEAAKDKDRPLIAGVIVNRLKLGMPMQIDATVLYALQQWRRLTYADLHDTISPYNTYLHNGLPPGPICSPTLKSVEAALHPAANNYLYYVALPNGYSLFASTLAGHSANIAKRRAALAALAAAKANKKA
ncbi:MAG TPA: endolytic transglycosylase MltG [Fimbriimonadaceae bacterium]|jgi:UPF0755 protein